MSTGYIANMTGNELRQRITRLGLTYAKAAELLGLSLSGLNHQMRGERAVTRQTKMLLERLEAEMAPDVVTKRKRRV
jgi:transcriptional regulator with XRE-family HTH domain